MQVITDAFRFGYTGNRHCYWFGAPALPERLFRPLTDKDPSDYTSEHGRTNGKFEPAECGVWWYRFFRRDPAYVTVDDVSARKMTAFLRSIASLEAATGLPLIFKNLYACLRLEPMAHYLPNALYVVMERDWVANGHSILKGRYDTLGDYGQWWSVPPPNVHELSELPPAQQVVGQIESIHDLINRDVQRLGLEGRIFRMQYEDFCNDVHGALDAFQDFMANNGVGLERRHNVPQRFPVRHTVKIPESIYEELKAEVARRKEEAIVKREGGG